MKRSPCHGPAHVRMLSLAFALASLGAMAGCPPERTPCQVAYDRIAEAYAACKLERPLTEEPQQCSERDQRRTACDAACAEKAGCPALARTDAAAEQRYAQCIIDCRAALQ